MIEFLNQDSSYFIIRPSGFEGPRIRKMMGDVKSLSITEEEYKLVTGSVTMHDPDNVWADVIKPGFDARRSLIEIEWGYKDPKRAAAALIPKVRNPTEIVGPIFRTGVKAIIMGTSGSQPETGDSDFTFTFQAGYKLMRSRRNQVYSQGTRGTVISQVFLQSGIVTPFVLFEGMETPVTPKAPLRQTKETDFAFLQRLAKRWGKFFRVGTSPTGQDIGAFVDFNRAPDLGFDSSQTLGLGRSFLFEYRGGARNVISGDWENDLAGSGLGDNVQIRIINGEPIAQRTTARTETIQAFEFDREKMKTAFERIKSKNGIEAARDFMQEILAAKDFFDPQIQKFWRPVEYKTAPNSAGHTVNVRAFGNPLYTTPSRAKLGVGYPQKMQERKNWRIASVTHTIDTGGYFCDLEIKDFYGQGIV